VIGMKKLRTPLELYKLLPRTNCGDCGLSSCMAFAASVINREKMLSACPHLDPAVVSTYSGSIDRQVNLETIQEEKLAELKSRIAGMDLRSRAEATGGYVRNRCLVLSCLGKEFEVDPRGGVASHCHTHAWFSIPLLDYVLSTTGSAASGRWLPFRELSSGSTWSRLFEQRCEKPLRLLADAHSDLFADLINLFSGAHSVNHFNADVSVLLHPLPKVPLLVCYWKQEDGMDSRIHLFFDDTAEEHLHIDSLFTLATGIVRMLEKIMVKHTGGNAILS
jgi:hypothetical protein